MASSENSDVASVVAQFGPSLNVRVAKTIPLETDFIVLLDWRESLQQTCRLLRNLFRIREDGTVVWTIGQPEAMGVIVNVDWRYRRLFAWTSGCYMLTIDERTGAVRESVFTK